MEKSYTFATRKQRNRRKDDSTKTALLSAWQGCDGI